LSERIEVNQDLLIMVLQSLNKTLLLWLLKTDLYGSEIWENDTTSRLYRFKSSLIQKYTDGKENRDRPYWD